MQHFKGGALEQGSVNGLNFIRFSWNGRQANDKIQGAFYMAKDGNRFLVFTLMAPDPDAAEMMRLMENAVLTTAKK